VSNNPRSAELMKDQALWTECKKGLHKVAEVMRARKGTPVEFKEDEMVWLDTKNLTTSCPMKKLSEKRIGPFKVLEKIGTTSYKLDLPPTWRIHPIFHSDLLSRFSEPIYDHQKGDDRPPPDVIDDHEEYEVERILDSRFYRRKLQYLVLWKGYPPEDATWEPEKNVEHAPDAIVDFHHEHPGAPRRIHVATLFYPCVDLCHSGGPSYPWWNGLIQSHQDVNS
jgi:hypothetical protein